MERRKFIKTMATALAAAPFATSILMAETEKTAPNTVLDTPKANMTPRDWMEVFEEAKKGPKSKSEIIRELAQEQGLKTIDIKVAKLNPLDIKGLPVIGA